MKDLNWSKVANDPKLQKQQNCHRLHNGYVIEIEFQRCNHHGYVIEVEIQRCNHQIGSCGVWIEFKQNNPKLNETVVTPILFHTYPLGKINYCPWRDNPTSGSLANCTDVGNLWQFKEWASPAPSQVSSPDIPKHICYNSKTIKVLIISGSYFIFNFFFCSSLCLFEGSDEICWFANHSPINFK